MIRSSQFTVHDWQFTVHGSWFTANDLRLRLTVHNSQFTEIERARERQAQGREGEEAELGPRERHMSLN